MANEADFLVLTMYHRAASKEDPTLITWHRTIKNLPKKSGKTTWLATWFL